MIRILILLMALNTIFAPVSFASVCASDMSKSHNEEFRSATLQSSINVSSPTQHFLNDNAMDMSQAHCDHCDNMSGSMQATDCGAECSISCLSISVALPGAIISAVFSQPDFSKPVSGYINFYTRSISPELQPPLV